MFRKPYKVKTSNTLKGSDRRSLKSMVEDKYPNLTPESINAIISSKCELTQTKAMTHSGQTFLIYYSNSIPVFFRVEDILYPSVYTLWKHTDILPTVVTVPPVLEKICNGADLMAPGVIADECAIEEMRNLKVNDVCAVRIIGNKAAIAVGTALMSSSDLSVEGVKGKAVAIVHNYKDFLWASGDSKDLPLIEEQVLNELCEEIDNLDTMDNEVSQNEQNETISENEVHEDKLSVAVPDACEKTNEPPPLYSMDELMYHSFMTALKVHGSKIELPLLTSTFYSTYVIKSCPSEFNLDIKKSSYKKLSTFLKKMHKDGVITTKELSKGSESITSIKLGCDLLKRYEIDSVFRNHIELQKTDKPKKVVEVNSNIQENYKFPSVAELFVVSAQVKKLFEGANIKYVLPFIFLGPENRDHKLFEQDCRPYLCQE